jgi:hypothetical protein
MMSATNNACSTSAIEYFGGAAIVYAELAKAIRKARKEKDITPATLGKATDLKAAQILSFEATKAPPKTFKVHQVLRMLTQLGLVIEQVLWFRTHLSKEQRKYWIDSMAKTNEGFVVACGLHARVEPAIALELFIRVQALEELFASPRRHD